MDEIDKAARRLLDMLQPRACWCNDGTAEIDDGALPILATALAEAEARGLEKAAVPAGTVSQGGIAAPSAPADPSPDSIPMPQSEDQAVGMWLVGEAWVRANAPHRLRDPSPDSTGQGGVPRPLASGELPPYADITERGLATLPADVAAALERMATNTANLWADGSPALRQSVLAALSRVYVIGARSTVGKAATVSQGDAQTQEGGDHGKDFQLMLVRIIQRHRNGRDLTDTLKGAEDLLRRKGSLSVLRAGDQGGQ